MELPQKCLQNLNHKRILKHPVQWKILVHFRNKSRYYTRIRAHHNRPFMIFTGRSYIVKRKQKTVLVMELGDLIVGHTSTRRNADIRFMSYYYMC